MFSYIVSSLFAITCLYKSTAVEMTNDVWSDFNNFRERFNKVYTSVEEFESRFSIFKDNLKLINDHNQNLNFSLGINQFTDLTNEEFKSIYVTGIKNEVGSFGCEAFSSVSSGPDTFDWRSYNAVTSVKDQGQCGSCWAFSSTGAIESAWAISNDKLVDLSEQQLVDCATGFAYGSHGCNGGQMDGGFKYVINNGICSYDDYKYTSGNTKSSGSCQSCETEATISNCYDVKSKDQISLKGAVHKTPVSIAIEADTKYFQSYTSGILDASTCGTNLDHGVLIVGYGEENGKKYWIVKNSWGESWGENGYVRILRSDSTNDPGICGIAMQPSFPVV
jgi:KDEL-tailed cysteine endopeptidase